MSENLNEIEEETRVCPNYVRIGKIYSCETYKCPIDNADYFPGFNFESTTKCKTNGIISVSQASYVSEEKKKHESSRLERMNSQISGLRKRIEDNSKLAQA